MAVAYQYSRIETHRDILGKRFERISHARAFISILFDWSILGGSLWLAIHLPIYFFPLLMLIIGARQHGLLILMHEQVHFHLLRNQKLGEYLSDILLAFPLGISTRLYRATHFKHHEKPNSTTDPDFQYMKSQENWKRPRSQRAILKLIVKDLFFLNWKENLKASPFIRWWSPLPGLLKPSSHKIGQMNTSYRLFVAFYYLALLGTLILLSVPWQIPLIWVLSLMTTMTASVRLRALPEHLGVCDEVEPLSTRTIAPISLWQRFFIAPHHINIHREHHLNPRIPHYRLEAFRKEIRDQLSPQNEFRTYFGKKGAFESLIQSHH